MIRIRAFDGGEFAAHLSLPPGGRGPGLVVLEEIFGVNQQMRDACDFFASRGFVAICPDLFWRADASYHHRPNQAKAVDDVGATVEYLRSYEACTGRVGAVGYCLGGTLAYLLAVRYKPDASVGYYGAEIDQALDEAKNLSCPLMLHIAGKDKYGSPEIQEQIRTTLGVRAIVHVYPDSGHAFARIGDGHYDPAAAELADLRTLDFLHTKLAKPDSLESLWGEHIAHEFSTRDTEQTLATMVEDAYVNHIPVLTGGVGKDQLREFYSKHFIPQMPADTTLTPISRTVGDHQLVDEMIFRFTHTIRMDWMLPGVEPTGKRVEVPLVAIVRFRDGKLAHEHIYWDQASVLAQLGLIDSSKLPVAGIESSRKVLDPKLHARKLP